MRLLTFFFFSSRYVLPCKNRKIPKSKYQNIKIQLIGYLNLLRQLIEHENIIRKTIKLEKRDERR